MALYTGTLTDCGLESLAEREVTLRFRLERPAVTGTGGLIATREVSVAPAADGSFTVELIPSDEVTGAKAPYIVSASWLSDSGSYSRSDVFRFFALPGGGNIGEIVAPDWDAAQVIASETQPEPWPVGWAWWNTLTDDITQRIE